MSMTTTFKQTFDHRFDCTHEQLCELAKFLNDDAAFPTITHAQLRELRGLVLLAERCERLGQHTNLSPAEFEAAP